MTPGQMLAEMRREFPDYAARYLRVLNKRGELAPFVLNTAQLYLHNEIEKQLERAGFVRAIGLKGRQQGFSTYVQGRYYHGTTGRFGCNTGILTHLQDATDNIFNMVKRFHEHCPAPLRPSTKAENAKELFFDKLDSRYMVATAGSSGVGRGRTLRRFHGSEMAFWRNADTHMAGILQTVPMDEDTEIILESTADGQGNKFHRMWGEAVAGLSDFIPIFVPWFWQEEYRLEPPAGFVLNDDEARYGELHGLDEHQLYWRRRKIQDDFGGDVAWFDQEYPATPELAFTKRSEESFIHSDIITQAAKPKRTEPSGALVVGVDPAEYGDDRSVIYVRHGHCVLEKRVYRKKGPMEMVGLVADVLDKYKPDAAIFDAAIGTAIAERLMELGYRHIYTVSFGGKADRDDLYRNKRAEMYAELKEWLQHPTTVIPDDAALKADLAASGFTRDSSRRLLLESKEKIKERGPSPDEADALALTFGMPVRPRREREAPWQSALRRRNKGRNRSPMAA